MRCSLGQLFGVSSKVCFYVRKRRPHMLRWMPIVISLLALSVSVVALILSHSWPGRVELEPSGLCGIIRNCSWTTTGWLSDLFLLEVTWTNTGTDPVTINDIIVKLQSEYEDGGGHFELKMIGVYADLAGHSLSRPPTPQRSLLLPSHSAVRHVLALDPECVVKLIEWDAYTVDVLYSKDGKQTRQRSVCTVFIPTGLPKWEPNDPTMLNQWAVWNLNERAQWPY